MGRTVAAFMLVLAWITASGDACAQTLFVNDFENGVSRNTSGGIWTGYDNGFFGDPQWLEADSSHNHTPGGAKSARAVEADPYVYNSYADFGATGESLRATVYLYEDMTYTFPYTEPHEFQRRFHIEVRSMFTLFGDSAAGTPDETDVASDYLQLRLMPDLSRPEDELPVEPGQEHDFYTYGIRTKYRDDNGLGLIDTGVPRENDWLKLVIEADSMADGGEVRFFIDGALVGTSQRTGADWRWVMMGATGPTYENYWYDDISVVNLHGDYNGDGATDAADYVLWRKSAPTSVDAYNTLRAGFGYTMASGRFAHVLEPNSMGIVAVVGLFTMGRIRSARRNRPLPRAKG